MSNASLTEVQITPQLKGTIAVPEGSGPWPAVVMVHEVFGIDENMRAQMTRLAQAGYVVVMPDLYSRGGMRKCLTATFKALASGSGQAFEDVEAAKTFVKKRSDVTDKIGVIGFCMGGGFALLLANQGYDAANANYGMLPKNMHEALEGACPILGNYGAKDSQLKDAKTKLDSTLTELGVEHDIKLYENSGHAFMNPKQGGGPVFGTLLRITGAKPNPEDAVDAWNRIESFFAKHLTSS
ncbi:MAG: dienelactone hydrolase family protein [Rhodoluna sp.]